MEAKTIVPATIIRIDGAESNTKAAVNKANKFGTNTTSDRIMKSKPLFFFLVIVRVYLVVELFQLKKNHLNASLKRNPKLKLILIQPIATGMFVVYCRIGQDFEIAR